MGYTAGLRQQLPVERPLLPQNITSQKAYTDTLSARLYSSRKRQDKIVIKENKMLVVYCTLRPYFSPPWCRNMANFRKVHDRDVFRFHSVLSKEFEVRYNTCNFGFNSHQHRSPQIIRSTHPQRRLIRWLG